MHNKSLFGLVKGVLGFLLLTSLSACSGYTAAQGPSALQQPLAPAEEGVPAHRHIEDVIYGRKYGTCLTYDVFIPVQSNGAAIVSVDTGGFVTDHDHIWAGGSAHFLERGYTVFHVVHGSAPKFSMAEQVYDVQRAIKFIRFHADDYGIDPNRMGMTGASAGGYLAVMMSVTDSADPDAKDPIERMSSKVQAVACFCPPTKIEYRRPATRPATMPATMMASTRPARPAGTLLGAMSFLSFMEKPRSRVLMGKGSSPGVGPGAVVILSDEARIAEICKSISPVELMNAQTSPTLIIQGELDKNVGIDATKAYAAKLTELGVPAKYISVPGAPHAIPNALEWTKTLADWFDIYLAKK